MISRCSYLDLRNDAAAQPIPDCYKVHRVRVPSPAGRSNVRCFGTSRFIENLRGRRECYGQHCLESILTGRVRASYTPLLPDSRAWNFRAFHAVQSQEASLRGRIGLGKADKPAIESGRKRVFASLLMPRWSLARRVLSDMRY